MLANARLCGLLAFFLAFLLSVCLPAAAQVPGVASSAITFGISGNMNPVSGTTSTLGPGGYSNVLQPFLGNCCAFSVLSPGHLSNQPSPPFSAEWRHRHDDDDLMPVAVPIYIPYAIGYQPDEEGDGQGEASDESADASAPAGQQKGRKHVSDDSYSANSSDESDDNAEAEAPEPAQEPVIPQPATVLVYKDGHRADVVNYAIVGDALFEFDDGRTSKILLAELDLAATEKANDARGVDFKLPSSYIGAARQ